MGRPAALSGAARQRHADFRRAARAVRQMARARAVLHAGAGDARTGRGRGLAGRAGLAGAGGRRRRRLGRRAIGADVHHRAFALRGEFVAGRDSVGATRRRKLGAPDAAAGRSAFIAGADYRAAFNRRHDFGDGLARARPAGRARDHPALFGPRHHSAADRAAVFLGAFIAARQAVERARFAPRGARLAA